MQPLTRSVPRLFFDSISVSSTSRVVRNAHRPWLRSRICVRCKVQSQRRLFADNTKPPASSSSFDNPQASILSADSHNAKAEFPSASPGPEDVSAESLPSAADQRRSDLNQRFSHLMDHLQSNIFIASQRINDLTGYSGIETLKQRIQALENGVETSQEAVRSSRAHYKSVIASRAATQREVTTLLARKDSWTPIDLERFTSLYRMDHSNEQAVQEAATKLADVERDAEVVAGKLSSAILGRYHEEQIWSDKIRRMSTWGTWGLMGVNVLLFLVFQLGFEPWRRKRLVGGFEEKVLEALEKERERGRIEGGTITGQAEAQSLNAALASNLSEEKDATMKSEVAKDTSALAHEGASEMPLPDNGSVTRDYIPILDIRDPATWRPILEDLFSPRLVQLRKQDVTTIALEGAAAGAAFAAIIATLIFRPS